MNTISLNRLKYLFREYFALHWKRDLAIFGALFLIKILFTYMHFPFPDTIIVPITVILCGTFNFWHKKPQGMNYLMIPTNTEEKVIANILLVHVYYTAMLVLSCLLGLFIGKLICPTTFISSPSPFLSDMGDLFSYNFYEGLLAIQVVFIFTSIYFRKNAVLKTFLLFVALVFIMVVIASVLALNIGADYLVETLTSIDFLVMNTWMFHAFNWITILFFWVLSYFRLRETEV